ncbi:MAG: type II toxin-antitoxin system Phd/YefM family antitoxin [Candidatus Obscuribacter sp.]|nr:type II toxin-antitoxin system Phd/YefM family antitoxin [Candidatus Obscuribacter sp.]MBK9202803.1 type II toxin-antitoxin system Phd/YefM family antitoxin [Candidatus Obscuribacter sp.]
MPNLKDIEKQAAKLMGLSQKSIGKTQARKEFFPLVDALNASASSVEITDHDKPVAVIMSYQNYVALTAKLCMLSKQHTVSEVPNLIGSIKIRTNNLEAASQRASDIFAKSLKDTRKKL